NLVKDARKVQQTVLLVGDVSEMYVNNFGKMMNDPNFSPRELTAIANGYSTLLNESTELLKELKQIVSSTGLSLNDKERMDIIDRVYKEVKDYHSLVRYYTNKNISVSILRAKNRTTPNGSLNCTARLNKNTGKLWNGTIFTNSCARFTMRCSHCPPIWRQWQRASPDWAHCSTWH